jgi:hypothetical protein
MEPQYYDIRHRIDLHSNILDPRQLNIIRLRSLHVATLMERADIMMSSTSHVPLNNAASIVRTIQEILRFCGRREVEYRLMVTKFELAFRNLLCLPNLTRASGSFAEVTALMEWALISNKTKWEICSPEEVLDWIIGASSGVA